MLVLGYFERIFLKTQKQYACNQIGLKILILSQKM